MKVAPVNFKILAHILEIEGFDSTGVLKLCGVASAAELDDDGPWLPVSLFDHSMAAAIEVTGDACFGLVAGRSLGLTRYSVFTQLVLVAPTLRQVFEDLGHFSPLVVERTQMELAEADGSAQIVVRPLVENARSGNFWTEQLAVCGVHMVRLAGGDKADFQVELPYACPAGQEARYVAALGPRVRFGQEHGVIRFNPRLLDCGLQTSDPVAYAAARTVAESALAAMKAGTDVVEKVRHWLLAALPRQPSVAETAKQFRMNERCLRRHLGARGITHGELVQQCLRLKAGQLLADRDFPIKQVADQLGFSSVASFHRAFRHWTQMTPVQWRVNPGAAGMPADR